MVAFDFCSALASLTRTVRSGNHRLVDLQIVFASAERVSAPSNLPEGAVRISPDLLRVVVAGLR